MTARSPTFLKSRFEQGDIPQGVDYEDLIDSYLNVEVSGAQSLAGPLTITGEFFASEVSANSIRTSAMRAVIASATTFTGDTAKVTTVSAANVFLTGSVFFDTVDVSAVATTQASAVTLSGDQNFVIFADGSNDSVILPASVRGRKQVVINAASTTIKIFPAVSGRFVTTALNLSLNIPAKNTALVFHQGDERYGILIGGF